MHNIFVRNPSDSAEATRQTLASLRTPSSFFSPASPGVSPSKPDCSHCGIVQTSLWHTSMSPSASLARSSFATSPAPSPLPASPDPHKQRYHPTPRRRALFVQLLSHMRALSCDSLGQSTRSPPRRSGFIVLAPSGRCAVWHSSR